MPRHQAKRSPDKEAAIHVQADETFEPAATPGLSCQECLAHAARSVSADDFLVHAAQCVCPWARHHSCEARQNLLSTEKDSYRLGIFLIDGIGERSHNDIS